MKIQSRDGFQVGQRVFRKSDRKEGVVTGIKEVNAVKGALNFALTVKLDGSKGPVKGNAVFFEPSSAV